MKIPMPERMKESDVWMRIQKRLNAGEELDEFYYTEEDVAAMIHSIAVGLEGALPATVDGLDKRVGTNKDLPDFHSKILLSGQFWDCECKEDFIHPNTNIMCVTCGAIKIDQPSSRANEVATGRHRAPIT